MNTFEPLAAGMIVFGIILLSGALLLCYIFLNMKYSKRNRQLLVRELDRRYLIVEKVTEEVFAGMSPDIIKKIRDVSSGKKREELLGNEIEVHLTEKKKVNINTDAVRSLLLVSYFGGYKDF